MHSSSHERYQQDRYTSTDVVCQRSYGAGLRIGLAPTYGQAGPASLGLDIGIFFEFLRSVLLFNAISGLGVLGRALSRPQLRRRAADVIRPRSGPARGG